MGEITPRKIQIVLERIGQLLRDEAKRRCPVDMGELRNSIDYKVEGNTVLIFTKNEHARDMEYGAPPRVLDETEKKELSAWAKRHKASEKGMINYIQTKGIKVGTAKNPLHITSFGRDSYRPFMRPALHQSMDKIQEIIKRELK